MSSDMYSQTSFVAVPPATVPLWRFVFLSRESVPASSGVFEPRPFSVTAVRSFRSVIFGHVVCHLTGTSGGPSSLGDCRVEVGHVSGEQENLDSVSSRVQRSIQMQPPRNFHHSLVVSWWTSRQRSSEASIDLGQAAHGHLTADQICLCHTAPNSDAAP